MKKKIAILHFYPIEYYPPVLNLLNYFSDSNALNDLEISVFTCANDKGREPYCNNFIRIYRYELANKEDNSLVKAYKYLRLILGSLGKVVALGIETIVYFETISSLPVSIYKIFFRRNCNVFIHYHEYASKSWYDKYMKLVKYSHYLETRFLYNEAVWISQTNDDRKSLFQKDYPNIDRSKMHIMPNFPPIVWLNYLKPLEERKKNRIVYVGSLAFESSYIREFCEWIKSQELYSFDIYSYNIHKDVAYYLNNLKNERICYYEKGIEYDLLPTILNQYSIGVILHKAFNENYKYNATNKLFEYLACDLNVWFSKELLGCYSYVNTGSIPEVKPIDFLNLKRDKSYRMEQVGNYEPQQNWCEDVYNELLNEIKSK